MIANDIISSILNRYKIVCSKYSQSPSFIPNTKGDSFYLIKNRGEGLQPTQIRLSNHGTYLETWCDRNELGDSVERLNPAFCVNISIVFVDEGEDLTDDCKGMPNCDNCKIEPCKPQTFEGQDQIGRPFTVIQYVYNSKCIRRKYINGLTKAIVEASTKGKYADPLAELYRAAKEKEFHSSTKLQNNKGIKPENKQYNNMNNKLIRLTEQDLHRIVKESVNKILKEDFEFTERFNNVNDDDNSFNMFNKKGRSEKVPLSGDYYGKDTEAIERREKLMMEYCQELIWACHQQGILPELLKTMRMFEKSHGIEVGENTYEPLNRAPIYHHNCSFSPSAERTPKY